MRFFAAIPFVLTVACAVFAADPVSGLRVGAAVPGPFEPLHITGPDAGDESCLYCKYGNGPVAMVFARKATPALTELATKIEKTSVENRSTKLGSCVVFLGTSEPLMVTARKLADDAKLRETVVAVVEPEKVKAYEIPTDAEVTVVLYHRRTIQAVHQFRDGQLSSKGNSEVIEALKKLMAEK